MEQQGSLQGAEVTKGEQGGPGEGSGKGLINVENVSVCGLEGREGGAQRNWRCGR